MIVRSIPNPAANRTSEATLEWLVTNGLGGYASGAVSGVMTRRHHGLLVAAFPAPLGRMVMLSHLQVSVRAPRLDATLLDEPMAGTLTGMPVAAVSEFRLECGLPVWIYQAGRVIVERRIVMPHRQNTVHVTYRVIEGPGDVRLDVWPFMHLRHYESPLSETPMSPYTITAIEQRYEIRAEATLPTLRLSVQGCRAALTLDGSQSVSPYHDERHRGYPFDGHVWSPGYFQLELSGTSDERRSGTLVASSEGWDRLLALTPDAATAAELQRRQRLLEQAPPTARDGLAAELVLAADQFIISPIGRSEDAAREQAAGSEALTVIAGYHWFTDWGRDTMISLEGLTLATGRHQEAAFILKTFAHHVRDGLIPNMFPDGERDGLYHTADATLWFFHALDRYVRATGDVATLTELLPTLQTIVTCHVNGTRFGIGIDPGDGLLRQGADGYQLTWMDAKVDDWVVTPRRGKAVEINALFYNALRLMEGWIAAADGAAAATDARDLAARVYESFNRRFWCEPCGHLYDVVDGEAGDDASCRPNQIFAMSLPHPVLAPPRWMQVFETVRGQLLTPVGLRSLAPGHAEYRAKYYGDLRARDAAYHQGTVWAWLIGPFVDAWRRVAPEDEPKIQALIRGFGPQLSEAGAGSVSEIFDAQSPYTPRGCIAQAWSVAELLRVMTFQSPTDASRPT